VGGRLKPKSGLQTYFEPLRPAFQRYQFPKRHPDRATKGIPTADAIDVALSADISVSQNVVSLSLPVPTHINVQHNTKGADII